MSSHLRVRMWIVALLVPWVLGGCISSKSYVDPTFGKVRYDDLERPATPLRLQLTAQFERNGERMPGVDGEVYGHAERVLRASGLIEPMASGGDGEIIVTVNNIADTGEAAAKGAGTGFTFGLAGSVVTDHYEMSVTIKSKGKTITKSGYKHALHTTIGNESMPEGWTPTTAAAGFGTVVEQMLLNALKDLQQSGVLARLAETPGMQLVWLPPGLDGLARRPLR